ncbi:MAG: nicotinate phosphoribosyltransferase [bacterium]
MSNFTMLTDFYELTMANGYYQTDYKDKICYFDVFFRKIPESGGYAIFCGLGTIIEYIKNLKFTKEDIKYLEKQNIFSKDFLEYLKDFKFTGDIYAIEEGSVVFPNEPLITVRANTIEAQIIETYLLLTVNHQSLIATKTNRIVEAAKGKGVLEFGARRAHGESAAINGAKAAYVGGVIATSNTMTDMLFDVKASGTMAHSWVQMFDTEYEAFKTYCEIYPTNATLLVDTYNVLKSGIPNAIKVVKEVLWPKGIKSCGIRIDSGDMTYLTKQARIMLDKAGLEDCKIFISNSLDEYIITDLLNQGAPVDAFGVGERLITARAEPVFGGVYKLCAIENEGKIIPKIKVSENEIKITNPGFKKIFRIYDKESNKALADLITLHDESIDESKELVLFDPVQTWKKKEVTNFYAKELLKPIFINGKYVYKEPTLKEVRQHCVEDKETLWEETKRLSNPNKYYVDLSQKLWDLKNKMLNDN